MSWIFPNDHEHDENGNCIPVQVPDPPPPEYPLQIADIIGIGILSVSNLSGAVANSAQAFHNAIRASLGMLSREFFAHANARRAYQQAMAERTLLADDLRSLEEGGDHDNPKS